MDSQRAYFNQTDANHFVPTQQSAAQSHWATDHLHGSAVIGLAAFALEGEYGLPDFLPSRLTVDLFKSARARPMTTHIELIRDGRRVRTSLCTVEQDRVEIARAVLVQYRLGEPPLGEEWVPEQHRVPRPVDDGSLVQIFSEGVGWTPDVADHQNTERKGATARGCDVVAGTPNSPFVRAASVVDGASLVTNLGTAGLGYINGDATLALARLPRGEAMYLQADTHCAFDGVAIGTTTLLDDDGPFGCALVTALSNRDAQIDFAGLPLNGS